jgi:antitoxin HigA-1
MAHQVLDKKGKEITTDVTLHPGEVLEMELDARGIKKIFFAAQLGIRPSQLSELIHGKRHVNAVMAVKLQQLLEIEAEFWMRVQSEYDINMARRAVATM